MEIILKNGLIALFDNEDFEKLIKRKRKWVVNSSGYVVWKTTVKRKIYCLYMHRVVMGLGDFKDDNRMIDHVNGNKLDNRKINLRLATIQQNIMSRGKIKGGSLYKGVSWDKQSHKWVSQICYMKKRIKLGHFIRQKDAALRYNIEAKKLFKGFAFINIIKNN